ncbi:rCG31234 [Rattus norvegicus]|uniref:RCG31234 n=1 Tax=Rattus norvegicus TaxID=10116 RepID=A6ISG1_RAT|nr:rCG31234 [Rattus norvegicus]
MTRAGDPCEEVAQASSNLLLCSTPEVRSPLLLQHSLGSTVLCLNGNQGLPFAASAEPRALNETPQ